MFLVALRCPAGHSFDGWFDRAADVDAALARGDAPCPACGSVEIERRPSFRGIAKRGGSSLPTAPTAPTAAADQASAPAMPLPVQRFLSKVLAHVHRHGEDAGAGFSARARAMNQGDEPSRLIYGTSTPEEERALRDDGVPYVKVPVPDIDVN